MTRRPPRAAGEMAEAGKADEAAARLAAAGLTQDEIRILVGEGTTSSAIHDLMRPLADGRSSSALPMRTFHRPGDFSQQIRPETTNQPGGED